MVDPAEPSTPERPQKRGGLRWGIGLIGGVIVAGLVMVLWPVSWDAEGSPREKTLADFAGQLDLGPDVRLVWAPVLVANSHSVGAVFGPQGFALPQASGCAVAAGEPRPLTFVSKAATTFKYDPELLALDDGKANLEGVRTVSYSLALEEALSAESIDAILEVIYAEPACVAAIANQPVSLLFATYSGDETFSFVRSLGGAISSGAMLSNTVKKLGLEASWADTGDITNTDMPLIWALTEITLEEPRLPLTASAQDKLTRATQLIDNENEFLDDALFNTATAPPSDAALEAILSKIGDTPPTE